MTQLEGLCPHDRLTTAYCGDCALEAEIIRPNQQVDWNKFNEREFQCMKGDGIECYCPECEEVRIPHPYPNWGPPKYEEELVFKEESWDPLEAYYVPNAKPSAKQVGGKHYKEMEIQPHFFCHKNRLGALESNVVKYICRHHQKGGLQDLEKARHYIDLLIEWEYGEETTS